MRRIILLASAGLVAASCREPKEAPVPDVETLARPLGPVEAVLPVFEAQCTGAAWRDPVANRLSCQIQFEGDADKLSMFVTVMRRTPTSEPHPGDGTKVEVIQVSYSWGRGGNADPRPECKQMPAQLLEFARALWPEPIDLRPLERVLKDGKGAVLVGDVYVQVGRDDYSETSEFASCSMSMW